MGKFRHGIDLVPIKGEIWKPIQGFEGLYEASSLGRIKSLPRLGSPRTTIMQFTINTTGYFSTAISKDKIGYTKTVHRMVAIAFLPRPDDYYEINHIDGNKLNNKVDNLEWCNRSQNIKHCFDIGLKDQHADNHHSRKIHSSQVLEIHEKYKPRVYTRQMLADEYGLSVASIKKILNKTNWASIW